MPKIIESKLIEKFKDRESFSRRDLFDFYREFEPNLKEGTFGWRIYNLKKRNVIRPIKRGLYTMSGKSKYRPEITPDIIKLVRQFIVNFRDIDYCIWETRWLNEFSQHQANKKIIIIEIEKEFVESLYYELKDRSRNNIFLNPNEKDINFYIAESEYPVIIKKLVTRSPVITRTEGKTKFHTPELEKILVDLFAEDKLFHYLQGSELRNIYTNALTNYSINYSKLFSYAKRRGREQEIKKFITTHMSHQIKKL